MSATSSDIPASTTSSSISSLPPNRQYTVDASGKVIEEKELDSGRTVKYQYEVAPPSMTSSSRRIPVWLIVLIGAIVGVLLLTLIRTVKQVKSMPSRPRWSSGPVLKRPQRPSINTQLDIKRGELAMLEHAEWAARPYPTWSK